MAEKSANIITVSQGQRHWAERILAALFFAAVVFTSLNLLCCLFVKQDGTDSLQGYMDMCYYGLPALALGLRFGTTKTVMINQDKEKLISRYNVGPISYSQTTEIPVLDYIAVYRNPKDEFEVNLWYKGNKHYNMFTFLEKADAFAFAQTIVPKLKLDLLDATERGNSKWTEYSA